MSEPTEKWRPIKGFPNYEVSNRGRIKSWKYSCDLGTGPRIRKLQRSALGYRIIMLSVNGFSKNFKVHRLVALAFIPNPKRRPHVNHKDGNPANNRVRNLEWCNQSENAFHRSRVLFRHVGEKHCNSKLKNSDVRRIRKMLELGISQRRIADQFGVCRAVVQKIREGKSWIHVT